MAEEKKPLWTVHYNIVSDPPTWVGTGWQFFDDVVNARRCFDNRVLEGHVPTLRPFHPNDRRHMGACHRGDDDGPDWREDYEKPRGGE